MKSKIMLILGLSFACTTMSYAANIQEQYNLAIDAIELGTELNRHQNQEKCHPQLFQSTDAISEYVRQMQADNNATPEAKQEIINSTQHLVDCLEETADAKKMRFASTLNKISDKVAKVSKNLGLLRSDN